MTTISEFALDHGYDPDPSEMAYEEYEGFQQEYDAWLEAQYAAYVDSYLDDEAWDYGRDDEA